MENKSTFDKENFAKMIMQCFVVSYIHKGDVAKTYAKLRDKADQDIKMYSTEQNYQEKLARLQECRKIIERCRDFFKDVSLKKVVEKKIDEYRSETGGELTSSKIAENLLLIFSDEFWGDGKRKYNMSDLATTNTIPTLTNSKGKTVKAVKFVSFDEIIKNLGSHEHIPMRSFIELTDAKGTSIRLEFLGTLYYHNGVVSNEYIHKYRVTKSMNDVIISDNEVYSELDINELKENPNLSDVVASELLSKNNIEHSYADGYIGNITAITNSTMNVGTEKEEPGYYRYQINPKYSLEYNGEKIEAIRAFKERLALEKPEKEDFVDVEPEI